MEYLTTRPSRRQSYMDWRVAWSTVLDNLQPFRSSAAISGDSGSGGSTGILPGDWAGVLHARRDSIDYVIRSYDTPIAWHDRELGWVMPACKYSRTTTRHQSIVSTTVDCAQLARPHRRAESELEYENHLLRRQLDIAVAQLTNLAT